MCLEYLGRKIPKTLLGIETSITKNIAAGPPSRKIPKTLLGIETRSIPLNANLSKAGKYLKPY